MKRIVILAIVAMSSRGFADDTFKAPNCPDAVRDSVRAAFPTAVALACTENLRDVKWEVDVQLKAPDPKKGPAGKKPAEPAPKLLVETSKEGVIETVRCPPAVVQAIQRRLPNTVNMTCSLGAGPTTLSVDVPSIARAEVGLDGSVDTLLFAHADRVESGGVLMALLFWMFALISVGGAIFVITRRNLIAAVMGMVGSFLGISAVYMMLYAQFLAVIQMLVYAGAIMVLFVFVIMILNRPEDEPVAPSGRLGQVLGGAAILYLVGRLVMLLMRVHPPNGDASLAAPAPLAIPQPNNTVITHDWGSVKAVGTDLFGPGLFPFEAVSVLLLIAVVGAIAIARPLKEDEP